MTESRVDVEPDAAKLVRQAQAGDRRALSELIALHLPLIYNIIGRALNGHTDTDDVVQETMVQVVRGLPGLRDPERFRSWAVAIAYRQVQQHLRDRKKTLLHVREAALALDMPDPDGDFAERTVAELVLAGQRRELAEAARWLDDDDRRLLSVWWQEAAGELTRTELAAALTLKPRHAAVRLQRMKERLDAARGVVRALRATPRCADLDVMLRGWNGVADSLWRKRLVRHTRECARCRLHRRGLVPPEKLLLGLSALPLPVAATEGLRTAVEAAILPGAASAGQSLWSSVLAQLQGFLHNKAAATATAVTVAAGGGFAYAVYETRIPDSGVPAVAAPTAAPPSSAPAIVAPPPSAGPPSATPGRRARAFTGVASADVYVAPGGSDTGDGTLSRPYATLGKAVAVIRPGQTIALRGGTYRPTESVTIDTSGTAGRRITLSNYRDELPVLDASRLPGDEWLVTHRASYWTVQGLEIKNSRSHAYVCRACRANVFQRLSIHDNVRAGLTLRDPGTVDNRVLDSDFFNNYDPADRGRSGVGVEIKFGSGTGNLIRGCRSFNNADNGFDVGHFTDPVRLEYNWAYGNGVNRWNAADWDSNADGFHLGGGNPPPAAAHVVRHNAAWDNVGNGFSDGGNRGAVELTNNTAFRNGATGFAVDAAAAVLRGNAAIGNDSAVDAGDHDRSTGNTWDGGDWTAAMFRSTDPAAAQGRRRPDGRLPAVDFLVTRSAAGASMLPP